ncbi:MAG: polyhydroxyalkanoic acid system family protein [Myxococcota bacterium]
MSEVRVEEAHKLEVEVAKQKLGTFADEIKKYGMSLSWKGNEADLKGTGASGSVKVSATNVVVVVKLGMLAKAAGVNPDKLKDSISKRLKAALTA